MARRIFGCEVTIEPATEPLSLQDAKDWSRVEQALEDDVIAGMITATRQYIEAWLSVPLVTQTLTKRLSTLSGEIELAPQVQSINSIKYIDSDGAQQTLDASEYRLDRYGCVGSVCPEYDKSWPSVRNIPNSVEIEFIAGFGDESAVPQDIKQAIFLEVDDAVENRGQLIIGAAFQNTGAAANLLRNYRIITL